jgi:hypothetical protein
MTTTSKLAALGITAALAVAPGASMAAGTGHGGSATAPGHTKAPSAQRAFGRYCQGESKTVKAKKGTEFSDCVRDMAKLAHHKTSDPHVACKNESKTHVKGEKGTAFSRCVVAGNRLLKALRSA